MLIIVVLYFLFSVQPAFLPGGQIQDTNASAAEDITFMCNVEGLPLPSIVWYMDGQQVTETGKFGIHTVSDEVARRRYSNLTIVDVAKTDEGTFWCNASNFLFEMFEVMSVAGTLVVNCKF